MGLSPCSTKLTQPFNHVRSSHMSDHKQPEVSRRNLLIGGGASAIAAAFGGPITAMANTIDQGYGDNCVPGDASSLMASPSSAFRSRRPSSKSRTFLLFLQRHPYPCEMLCRETRRKACCSPAWHLAKGSFPFQLQS